MNSFQHTGNLLHQRGILVHNSNDQGVLGSQLNLEIVKRWPQVGTAYRKAWERNELWLGHVIFVRVNDHVVLANCITREFESDNKVYVNYEAVQLAYNRIAHYARMHHLPVHYTHVGNRTSNWSAIKRTIDRELAGIDHTLWLQDAKMVVSE
jgi:hypothetical protein